MSFNLASVSSEQSYDDALMNFFEPDTVLPSQYFDGVEAGVSGGERRLMAALLADGVEAYIASVTKTSAESASDLDARSWVECKEATYVFGFDSVCASLGINPDYLRLGLERYKLAVEREREIGTDTEAKSAPIPAWKKIRRPRK